MDAPSSATRDLLARVHEGDDAALRDLLERHLPWIRARVHARLGPALRAKAETGDLVHDAVVELLRYGPRFTVSDEKQFRAFLATIAENVLRNEHRRFDVERRSAARERTLPNDSVLDLDARRGGADTPSAISDRREREAWLRLGLELLRPEDREVILLRQQQRLSFDEVGAKLGSTANTARMRFERALGRLADVVTRLRLEGVEGVTKPG